MNKKALITGAEGFIGSTLAEFLLGKGLEVHATVHKSPKTADEQSSHSSQNLENVKDKITIYDLQIEDKDAVEKLISGVRPDYIFHLAAQAYVIPSWQDIEYTMKVNVLGTMYLYDAMRKAGINPVIVFASSSAGYGLTHEDEIPIKENKEFRPSSPYAVSKITADMLSYIYWRAYGMKIIRARIFNTIGPRKKGNAIADFAQMIAEIESGKRDELKVGNLESVLDFTDVRDLVNALWTLAEKGAHGEAYNICSGHGRKLREVLEMLISISGKNIQIKIDPAKFRPADDPVFVGDNSKLRALGWKPKIDIKQTLKDTLDYWRNVV